MSDYVALLRAVNLGAVRKFPMAELRALLERSGFEDVATYIQSGNVRLRSGLRSSARVAERVEAMFEEDRGFAVPTVVLTTRELTQVSEVAAGLESPAALAGEEVRRYVTFLRDEPEPTAVAELEALEYADEAAVVRGRCVHLWVRDGYRNARLDNARLEKLFGVATTRDLKVVRTLAERWGAA